MSTGEIFRVLGDSVSQLMWLQESVPVLTFTELYIFQKVNFLYNSKIKIYK